MLHPSYSELMDKINESVEPGEVPVVKSRYSVVIAASKRARQIIAAQEVHPDQSEGVLKPLSQAVNELYNGDINIMTDEEFESEMEKLKAEAENEIAFPEEEDSDGDALDAQVSSDSETSQE